MITSEHVVFETQFNPSLPNPGRREKIKLKAFIKPLEAPQVWKQKFNLICISTQFSEMFGTLKAQDYF